MTYLMMLVVVATVFVPSLVAVALVSRQRRRLAKDGRRSPIESRPIYGPGHQLRKRVDDHTDEMMLALAMVFFLGPLLLSLWALPRVPWSTIQIRFSDYAVVVIYTVAVGTAVWRIQQRAQARRIALAGLQAELYTAQELNRLMALGCTVLHDIPGERFNIDHVVIGPRAVYAIETKSVRKPKDDYKIRYDGERLHFPGFSDTKRLEQTRRQADWLAKHLRQVLGRPIPVIPALALPGWWIESSGPATDVQVFTPVGRGAHFMADGRGGRRIDAETAGLVTQALVMRYPADEQPMK